MVWAIITVLICLVLFVVGDEEPLLNPKCVKVMYKHPLYTSDITLEKMFEITMTKKNFCTFYPTCLAFNCCSDEHRAHIEEVHRTEVCNHYAPFTCMHKLHHTHSPIGISSCSYKLNFTERLKGKGVDWTTETITKEIMYRKFLEMPPTSVATFRALEKRCEFKVIYLLQGDYKSNIKSKVSAFSDMLYLSYKEKVDGDLYFPNSDFAEGRMALYLAARQLELSQGWLYNYFIFLDDDAEFVSGSFEIFEDFLLKWQPATAGTEMDKSYLAHQLTASQHFDMIFYGYHREAVEVLFPWNHKHDYYCEWASQLFQVLQAAALYRNHNIASKAIVIKNSEHHNYPRSCWSEQGKGFFAVIQEFFESLPATYLHCALPPIHTIDDFWVTFNHQSPGGWLRPKVTPYHFLPDQNYGLSIQLFNSQIMCSSKSGFDNKDKTCCSVDNTEDIKYNAALNLSILVNDRSFFAYHDHLVTFDDLSDLMYYAFNGRLYPLPKPTKDFELLDLFDSMGFTAKDVVHLSAKSIGTFPLIVDKTACKM